MDGDELVILDLRDSLAQLKQEDPALALEIGPIIWANWESGRIKTVLENHESLEIAGYIQRVLDTYDQWHKHVQLLQGGDEDTWKPFYALLQRWAYRLIERWQVVGSQREGILEFAQACAGETAIVLLRKPFPFDVHFHQWAYQVLRFSCLRRVSGETKVARDQNGNEILPLEEQFLAVLGERGDVRHVERRHDLLEAIDSLASEARKQFIVLYYFEGKTIAEIAAIMNRNHNATYKLHHDALVDLRNQWR